jgi:uncharacterized membrane protein YebE (DUF533 family)
MSLVGTLAKVAIGIAIAKGVSSMGKSASNAGGQSAQGGLGDLMGGMLGGGTQSGQSSQGGLGDLLGGLMGGAQGGQSAQSSQGGLGDLLGGLMGGSKSGQSAQSSQGGLGDLLGGLMGGAQGGQASQGGLGDLLGGLMGGAGGAAASGGLGGLLGGLMGGAGAAPANDQSLGQVLNSSFSNQGEPDVEPTAHQNAAAAIMIAAMIQAAKSDGAIQEEEKAKLLGNLKDASQEEMAFVQAQLAAPVSIPTLLQHVPAGMQSQVYTVSLMAIDLDSQAEAQYLNDLAKALGMGPQDVNAIHAQVGAPALYA